MGEREDVGRRLKAARQAKELAQEAAAHEIGVSVGTLSRYELGKLVPGSDVLAALADLYETTTDALLGRKQPAETTLEVDEIHALAVYRKEYKREHGRELPQKYVDAIVGLARSEGPDAITVEVIEHRIALQRAIERGKAQRRPAENEPKAAEVEPARKKR